MLLMRDEGGRPIFGLKKRCVYRDIPEVPARELVLKDESELFFDMESELIRSFYELDTPTVTAAVFEVTLIAAGK